MSGVAAVLLDQVTDQPAQAGMAAVGRGYVSELVEAAIGQGRVKPRARPLDGTVPERVELFGATACPLCRR